jgi:hypothetical protein
MRARCAAPYVYTCIHTHICIYIYIYLRWLNVFSIISLITTALGVLNPVWVVLEVCWSPNFEVYAAEHKERWGSASSLTVSEATTQMPEIERKYRLECAEPRQGSQGKPNRMAIHSKWPMRHEIYICVLSCFECCRFDIRSPTRWLSIANGR